MIELAEVKHFILNTERTNKSTFWHTALNRHLPAFMAYFSFCACTCLLAFCTFCRCAAMPATLTTAYTFYFLYRTLCRFQIVELHCLQFLNLRGMYNRSQIGLKKLVRRARY